MGITMNPESAAIGSEGSAKIEVIHLRPTFDGLPEPEGFANPRVRRERPCRTMPTPNETIPFFLADNGVEGPRSLDVSIALAESMICELRAALGEWEAVVDALNTQMRQAIVATN